MTRLLAEPETDKFFEIDPFHKLYDYEMYWACDQCLHSGLAVLADPSKQTYCWSPHLAYYDTPHVCQKSGNNFVFSKEEKRFWYEELQFWIESTPIHSPEYRREVRKQKAENKKLSEILSKPEDQLTTSELEQVIEIYDTWKKPHRKAYFISLLRKKSKQASS